MDKKEILAQIDNLHKILNSKYLSKEITSEEIKKLYIEYLKLSMLLSTNKPNYKDDLHDYKRGNCYCYALGIKFPYDFYSKYNELSEIPFVHSVGFISENDDAFTKKEIMSSLYNDLNVLNIKYKNTNINAKNKNGYKIAIYFDNIYKFFNNFHVARENVDGSWSEKLGYTSEILKFSSPTDSYYVKNLNYKLHKVLEITKPVIKSTNS